MNENFYKRLKELSAIDKTKTSSTPINSMTLVDFKRADDGTALGIIKENHNYYIKTSTSQGNTLSVADFAYIGGIENKRKYQYDALSKAEKQREFHMASLNEAFSFKERQKPSEAKTSLNESTVNPSNKKDNESVESFLKRRITEGKKTLNESTHDKFKKSLKPTEVQTSKKGLLPEQANYAIKKALGKLNESEVLITADSEIADADMVINKTGKENAQAPINDTNAKTKSNLGTSQPSDLVTSDSEIADADMVINKTGKENAQAPINDTNAKTKANLGTSQPSDLVTSDSEIQMSDSVIGLENADMKVSTKAVAEGKVLATADSKIKKSDSMSEKKGKESPQAPVNDSNAKSKSKLGTSQPSDLVTSDSKIKKSDSMSEKKGKEGAQAPINDTNAKTKSKLGTSQPSDLVTSDSKIKKSDSVNEDLVLDGLEDEFSDENQSADAELDAAAIALDDLEVADASSDTEISGDMALDNPDLDEPMSIDEPQPTGDAGAQPEMPMGGEAEAGAGAQPELPMGGGAEGGVEPEMPMGGGAEGGDLGSELPMDGGEEEGLEGQSEMPMAGGEEEEGGDGAEGGLKKVEKITGKLDNAVRNTGSDEITPDKTTGLLNQIIASFGDKLAELDVEDRKKIANKITKSEEEDEEGDDSELPMDGGEENSFDDEANEAITQRVASLEENGFEDDEDLDDEESSLEDDLNISPEEKKRGFSAYMNDRGYQDDSLEETSEEEMASVVSGWATAHGDGENDGDYKTVAIYLTPAIQKELEDSGHGDFIEKLRAVVGDLGQDQLAKIGTNDSMSDVEDEMVGDEEGTEEETPEMDFAPEADFLGKNASNDVEAEEEEEATEEPEAEEIPEPEAEEEVEATEEPEAETEEEPTVEKVEEGLKKKKKIVNESDDKVKRYIRMKIQEKLGLRKPVLTEGKKSPTSILIESIIDQEIESIKKKVNEGELDEFSLGGLMNMGKKVGSMASGAANSAFSAIENKINTVSNSIKTVGDELTRSYHTGAKNAVVDDIEKMALELGQLIAKLNAAAVKAGEEPINPKSILATIQNQISAAKPSVQSKTKPNINLGKFRTQ